MKKELDEEVCPAYAGMIPEVEVQVNKLASLSRVCGDDPMVGCIVVYGFKFVPRMRG